MLENKNIDKKIIQKDIILSFFKTFFENRKNEWIKNKDLIYNFRELNLKPVEVRELIKELRKNGLWIIADNRGYKLTDDKQELENYVFKRFCEIKKEMVVFKLMKEKHYYNIMEEKLW